MFLRALLVVIWLALASGGTSAGTALASEIVGAAQDKKGQGEEVVKQHVLLRGAATKAKEPAEQVTVPDQADEAAHEAVTALLEERASAKGNETILLDFVAAMKDDHYHHYPRWHRHRYWGFHAKADDGEVVAPNTTSQSAGDHPQHHPPHYPQDPYWAGWPTEDDGDMIASNTTDQSARETVAVLLERARAQSKKTTLLDFVTTMKGDDDYYGPEWHHHPHVARPHSSWQAKKDDGGDVIASNTTDQSAREAVAALLDRARAQSNKTTLLDFVTTMKGDDDEPPWHRSSSGWHAKKEDGGDAIASNTTDQSAREAVAALLEGTRAQSNKTHPPLWERHPPWDRRHWGWHAKKEDGGDIIATNTMDRSAREAVAALLERARAQSNKTTLLDFVAHMKDEDEYHGPNRPHWPGDSPWGQPPWGWHAKEEDGDATAADDTDQMAGGLVDAPPSKEAPVESSGSASSQTKPPTSSGAPARVRTGPI